MTEEYRNALAAIRAVVEVPQTATASLQQAMQIIRDRLPRYQWVGVYVLNGEYLDLGPYAGAPTVHTRIPVGVGVCGKAALTGHNQRVADVRALTNYLACSPTVRSEIVVLVRAGDRVVGQIDADSDEAGAFDEGDERFLGEVAALLAPLVARLRQA